MAKNIQAQLDKVFQHIETYNREMGSVLTEIKNIKEDVGSIKKCLNEMTKKVDTAIIDASKATPAWVTYVIGILMAIIGWIASGAFR